MTTRPTLTPWGSPDHVAQTAPGIFEVCTPSHGGAALTPERFQAMPQALRCNPYGGSLDGWHFFEEDTEAMFPLVYFIEELPERMRAPVREHAQMMAWSKYGQSCDVYRAAFAWIRARYPEND